MSDIWLNAEHDGPVTILAIIQQYKVDPRLYSVIFGESILHDGVASVMYGTFT